MIRSVKNSLLYNMNINFNISSIKLRAKSNDDFIEGLQIFDEGNVCNIAVSKIFDNESLEDNIKIISNVKDNASLTQKVELRIDTHGDVTMYKCNCEDHLNSIYSFCKHIVAVLLFIYNNNHSADMKKKTLHNILDSDYIGIINEYEDTLKKSVYLNEYSQELMLIPKLSKVKNDLELCVSIKRNNKSYIIKDIFGLAENIKQAKDFQYGKDFLVNHNINNFCSDSVQLAKLIVNLCNDYADVYGYSNNNYPSKKSIRVPKSQIEPLFNILKNSYVKYTNGSDSYEMNVLEKNPCINFTFIKNTLNNKFDFSIKGINSNACLIYDFINTTYIISENYFCKCDNTFKQYVLPALLKLLKCRNSSISISENNFSKFYSTVIVPLQKYSYVIIDENITSIAVKKDLLAKVYIDSISKNSVVADLIFCYDDMCLNALENNDNTINENKYIVRDILRENYINKFILNCGFICKSNRYMLTGEKNIFNFINSKLNELIEICEVNVSDNFKKIKVKSPSSFSMGIKLLNNLIELDLNNLEFSLTELKKVLSDYRMKKKYHRLKDGSFIKLENSYFDTLDNLDRDLDILSYLDDNNRDKVYLPKYKSINLEDTLKTCNNIDIDKSQEYKKILLDITSQKKINIEIPDQLKDVLRNYQRTGYMWLKTLSEYGLGGILADDMGLGKTLQIIALLLSEDNENLSSIVICPTSLIYNWINEVEKFAPTITTMAVTGPKSQREEMIKNTNGFKLIITSYDLLKRDISLYSNMKFKYCILDEAQYIKNSYTQNALSVKKIDSYVRFALTGTPIENSLSDLWSIFDYVLPDFLLSYNKFKDKFETPIIKENSSDALEKLHRLTEPFILRRLKTDVLKELPEKIEIISYAQMESKQKKLYLAELMKANNEFNDEIKNQGYERSQIKILALLTRLRQICCHPSLYIENYTGDSAKLNLCMQIVNDSIQGGHKILIFSQFTSMLSIISKQLIKQNIDYYELTGSTKSDKRIELIDKFNSDKTPIFLISLKAGGTGLNLTGADIVIHFDPWWNNSAQNQATDRAHRIGQTNKVQVFKLITKDTIEEKIEILQNKKQNLVDSVITKKEIIFNSLTKEEITSLFEF